MGLPRLYVSSLAVAAYQVAAAGTAAVAVGERDCHCKTVHVVRAVHTRFLVEVGASDSYA